MEQKGNKIENWEDQYKPLDVTYSERKDTPEYLEQVYSYELVRRHIVNSFEAVKGLKILEVGCGGARNSLYLALRGFDVTCADFSPEGIRLAQTNFNAFGAKGTFLVDDLMHSRIEENGFDCVMSFGLLEHFEDIQPLVRNLTRMVRPGGVQIHLVIPRKFSTMAVRNAALFFPRLVRNIVKCDFQDIFRRSFRDFPHYENAFSWKQYCHVFNEQGNAVIACEPGGVLLPLIMLPRGMGGKALVRLFHRQILFINDAVKRSAHPLVHFLAPTFVIVSRKK